MSPKIIGAVALVVLILVIIYVATRPPKGLYILNPGNLAFNGKDYTGGKTYADAKATVEGLGGVVATKSQLLAGLAKGWNNCAWGWVIDDSDPKNPVPRGMYASISTDKGCGGDGDKKQGGLQITSDDQSLHWCPVGYGPRPDGIPDSAWLQL